MGTHGGREYATWHDTPDEAHRTLLTKLGQKKRKGYEYDGTPARGPFSDKQLPRKGYKILPACPARALIFTQSKAAD